MVLEMRSLRVVFRSIKNTSFQADRNDQACKNKFKDTTELEESESYDSMKWIVASGTCRIRFFWHVVSLRGVNGE